MRLAPNLDYVERRKAVNPAEAAGIALQETKGMTTQTLDALFRLVSTGEVQGV